MAKNFLSRNISTIIYLSTPILLLWLLIITPGCTQNTPEPPPEPEIKNVSDEEMDQDAREFRENLSVTLADDLDISLWASEKLLGDMIALDMDDQGRALITTTNRSTDSEFDVRGLEENWLRASMTWENVEDRRAFLREELAPERSETNTFVPDFNEDGSHDWRDLTVQKEEIHRIEDLTGNGMANQSQLFIRDFNEEITDVAGAVVQHNDDVFLGVGPDMWRIKDNNNDGMADWKESISHGYNVHIGFSGHGMSGATVGPDGRIYWGIGDMGLNVVDKDGKEWSHPNNGAILRSEPDGSNFEVYAAGVRNTHEFSFDKYGNLITVDNDGDHAGEHERLVYLVNGSDSGWRINWQFGKYTDPKNNDYKVWMDEEYYQPHFEDQAAHVLPPLAPYHSGPTGFAYNPGTALNDDYNDHFFVMSFRGSPENSAIFGFTLKEKGASFELDTDQEVLGGLLAVGMDFGPDGALYMTDWLQGWGTKGEGRIWKLDDPDETGSEMRNETKNLLAEDYTERNAEDLVNLMGHADMRVRQKAQFELAEREDTESLLSATESSNQQLARIHGIWGLAQIGRANIDAVEPLIQLLTDSDSEIRAQSAKMLGDVRYQPAGESIIPLLGDEHPRVRFFAAEALGRIGHQPALQPIVEMLEHNNDEDVYLRHAGAIALSRLDDTEAVTSLADHSSRAVRVAAVVALKRMESPGVARFLQDEDEYIVTNAARAIGDDLYIDEALPALAAILDEEQYVNEQLIRRAINANLYNGTPENASRLASYALRSNAPEAMRVEALNTLASWPDASIFDRVTGRHRGELNNDPDVARDAFKPVADQLQAMKDPIKIAAIEAIASLGYEAALPAVFAFLQDEPSAEVRIASLKTLQNMNYNKIDEAVALALEDSQSSVRMIALAMIPEIDLPEESIVNMLLAVLENGTVTEQQTALKTLGSVNGDAAREVLSNQLELLQEGELAAEIELELIEAVEQVDISSLNATLEQYQAAKPADDALANYSASLAGGSAEAGQRIFYRNDSAQCVRCHAVNEQGGEVGPDLTHSGANLSREQILESLVAPGARLAPGYGTVTLELENGETVQGILQEETRSSVTVRTGGGDSKVVQNSNIAERTNSPSTMPDMSNILSTRDIRDLVEFLTTLK
ncbi:MAG: HEAT repeat domain-containing protein [Balneolales bacterium]